MNQQPYFTPQSPKPSVPRYSGNPTSSEKNFAVLAHLGGVLGVLVGGVPGFLGPFLVWVLKKDESAYIEAEAREALNFQLTLLILYLVILVIGFLSCFGMVFVLVPMIMQVIFGILAAVTASKGIPYRYPFNIRLIS